MNDVVSKAFGQIFEDEDNIHQLQVYNSSIKHIRLLFEIHRVLCAVVGPKNDGEEEKEKIKSPF